MKILTVIPVRGGSKGVPGKNIRPVCGKPLLAWTIECALATKGLDRIVVSSDDEVILDVARAYPGIMASKRPEELSRDQTPTAPVVAQVLAEEEANGHGPFDAILLLQVTAPLREPWHVAQRGDVNTVISVAEMREIGRASCRERV